MRTSTLIETSQLRCQISEAEIYYFFFLVIQVLVEKMGLPEGATGCNDLLRKLRLVGPFFFSLFILNVSL